MAKKRGLDMEVLKFVLNEIIEERELEPKFKNHKLSSNWKGRYECHLSPDWLLIYIVKIERLFLKEQEHTQICFRLLR